MNRWAKHHQILYGRCYIVEECFKPTLSHSHPLGHTSSTAQLKPKQDIDFKLTGHFYILNLFNDDTHDNSGTPISKKLFIMKRKMNIETATIE